MPDAGEQLAKNSCEGCHTDYDLLKQVHTPDPPSTGGGGCGGEAPHYEPYDRVVLRGDGYQDFKNRFSVSLPLRGSASGMKSSHSAAQ